MSEKIVELSARRGRTYGGLTAEQRTAARRERLIDAGIEVFGTDGYRAATIRGVIRASGLGERYFYENFDDLDDLMVMVCERIHDEVMNESLLAVVGAGDDPVEQIRAGLTAFITAITRDPRRAQIKLLEMAGAGDAVRQRRREGMLAMADLVLLRAPAGLGARGLDKRMVALGLIGAVNELLIEWFTGGSELAIDGLVEHCTAIFEGVLALANEQES
ncbi:MAG: TetR/AcrR family transcriptional regulator [Solirubrobacterales bacterium]